MPDILWHELRFFKRTEFDYPDEMAPQLIRQLEVARSLAGVPFIITSDYRPNDPKSHGAGMAVDLGVMSSYDRWHILNGLYRVGFKRIGDYDKHIHADIWKDGPTPSAWWDVSK